MPLSISDVRLSRIEGALPIYSQVAGLLRQQIKRGQLVAGERLPRELDLAHRLGVSRVPVRQALAILEREGLIKRRHGHGTFVADELRTPEVLRLNGVIGWSTAAGTRHRLISTTEVAGQGDVAHFFGLRHGEKLVRFVRSRATSSVPFNYIVNYLPTSLGQGMRNQDFGTRTMVDILRKRLRLQLGNVRQVIQAQAAEPTVASYLGLTVGAPVLYVETRIWRKNGDPVMFSQTYYRGDQASYSIEVPA